MNAPSLWLPPDIDRHARIRTLAAWSTAELSGMEPDRRHTLFVASAVDAYLRTGTDLVRDCLRIAAPKGSHWTPAVVCRLLDLMPDERQDGHRGSKCRHG